MALYGKVLNDEILEYQDFEEMDDQTLLPPGKPRWYEVVEVNAAYDPITQVCEGPTDVIDNAALQIKRTYSTRGKTTAEIDAMRQGKINGVHSEATRRLTPISGAAGSQQIMALTRLMQNIYNHTDWSAWSQSEKNTVQNDINRLQAAQANREVEDTKVEELQALTDPAAIHAYDVTTGWPT